MFAERSIHFEIRLMVNGFKVAFSLLLAVVSLVSLVGSSAAQVPPGDAPPAATVPTLYLDVGHSAPVTWLAYSPDGAMLATASADNTIKLWDTTSGKLVTTLKGHQGRVLILVFSPGGETLASASEDGDVRLWNMPDGQLKIALDGVKGEVLSLAFAPDGMLLATGGRDSKTCLWDTRNGKKKMTLEGSGRVIAQLAFSPDGNTLAGADGFYGKVNLWNVADGDRKATLQSRDAVFALAFSPDGKMLATANLYKGDKGDLFAFHVGFQLWNAKSASGKVTRPLYDLGEHAVPLSMILGQGLIKSLPPHPLQFSPDGSLLAAGSIDGRVRLWNAGSGALQATLQGHTSIVGSLDFSPDGKTLATASWDGTARLWDLSTRKPRAVLRGHEKQLAGVVFSPDGKQIATAGWDNSARLWDGISGAPLQVLRGVTGLVETYAHNPNGRELATGGWDNTVRCWDLTTGQLKMTLRSHKGRVQALTYSPDGKLLITGGSDGTTRIWDAASGRLKKTLLENAACVYAVAISPDGKTLATGSGAAGFWLPTGQVQLWDLETGALLQTLPGHTMAVATLAFSPDGKLVASGSYDRTVRLWDVATGAPRGVMRPEERAKAVLKVAFSPDGRLLATAGWDNNIRLWNVADASLVSVLEGHKNWTPVIVFSPDGSLLVSGGIDSRAMIWNVADGKCLAVLKGHEAAISNVAFSPPGDALATCDITGRVLWWTPRGERTSPGQAQLASFPPEISHPAAVAGAGMTLHDPLSGRLWATMLPMPEMSEVLLRARPIEIGAKALPADGNEWFVSTPEGYFDCSANAGKFIRWKVNGALFPAERYYRKFRRPDLVQQSLRGETVAAPAMSAQDVPPDVQFVNLKYTGQDAARAVTVTVQMLGMRPAREVLVFVNGRPLAPENAKPVAVRSLEPRRAAPALNTGTRAIQIGAKAIELGAKGIEIGAKGIEIGAKAIRADSRDVVSATASYQTAQQFVFRVPLPVGAADVQLRAVAYDTADLGSSPAEIRVEQKDTRAVPGNLYVLSVGIRRYKNGREAGSTAKGQFNNLRFAASDAGSVEQLLRRGNSPLYQRVEVYNGGCVVDEKASLANIRAGLKWLQQKVRPGQVDTVVIYLSGHGLSDEQGHYFFPTYEFDRSSSSATSLSGRELQQELGGKLRAKAVFLFVDTCHSGALAGARSDDLNFEVNASGAYLMASSAASQFSYESPKWAHGAFTLALLRSLARTDLARSGVIHFNVLSYAVPETVAALMHELGENDNISTPVVPLEGRRLDAPVSQVHQ